MADDDVVALAVAGFNGEPCAENTRAPAGAERRMAFIRDHFRAHVLDRLASVRAVADAVEIDGAPAQPADQKRPQGRGSKSIRQLIAKVLEIHAPTPI